MNVNPWKRIWIVGFVSGETHWFLRLFYKARAGFDHVWMVSPAGDDRWVFVDWSLMGGCCRVITQAHAERLFLSVSDHGGMLRYVVDELPERAISRAVVPTSCAGYLRQILALPATWAFWHTPTSLWCELRERGAEVLLEPKIEPRR